MNVSQILEMLSNSVLLLRVDEELQILGFDSSLMDLVAEVEQMVAFKQANASPADRQPAGRQHLSPRAALLQRPSSIQVAYFQHRLTVQAGGCYPVAHRAGDFVQLNRCGLICDPEKHV